MTEESYRDVTYDLPLAVAETLGEAQPRHDLHLCLRRRHRQHRARPHEAAYMFRFTVLKALLPKYVTTTERLWHAMIEVARQGAPKLILESDDINSL